MVTWILGFRVVTQGELCPCELGQVLASALEMESVSQLTYREPIALMQLPVSCIYPHRLEFQAHED